jgi:ABC-type lipoprotein export system ATPase subunit
MGASGSGKSTLLHLLGLLEVPDDGSVDIGGVDTSGSRRRRADRVAADASASCSRPSS